MSHSVKWDKNYKYNKKNTKESAAPKCKRCCNEKFEKIKENQRKKYKALRIKKTIWYFASLFITLAVAAGIWYLVFDGGIN